MIGLGFREHGGPAQVGWVEVPEPVAGPDEVRVRVRAAAFNRLDRFVLDGIPGVPIERPHVLGSDASGTVDAVGANVPDLAPGTRVLVNPGIWDATCEYCRAGLECYCRDFRILGEHTQGSVTRYIVVPSRNLYPIPAELSFESAAAVPLVFQTAWRAIVTVGEVAPGNTVAIIGAGGGVATAAIQVARSRGGRVVVVTRDGAKAEGARKLGAEEVVVTGPDRPHDKLLWEWSGKRGIDLVFDSVGGPTLARSVRALARGGRVVVIGATGGPNVDLDVRTLFWRGASIRGSTMGTRREFEAAMGEVVSGAFRPVIDRVVPWAEAATGFGRLFANDLFGKVVVHGPAD